MARRPLTLVVANKTDLAPHADENAPLDPFPHDPSLHPSPLLHYDQLPAELRRRVHPDDVHHVSCHNNDGIDGLIDSLGMHLEQRYHGTTTTTNDKESQQSQQRHDQSHEDLSMGHEEPAFVTRERHRTHLVECVELLQVSSTCTPQRQVLYSI